MYMTDPVGGRKLRPITMMMIMMMNDEINTVNLANVIFHFCKRALSVIFWPITP